MTCCWAFRTGVGDLWFKWNIHQCPTINIKRIYCKAPSTTDLSPQICMASRCAGPLCPLLTVFDCLDEKNHTQLYKCYPLRYVYTKKHPMGNMLWRTLLCMLETLYGTNKKGYSFSYWTDMQFRALNMQPVFALCKARDYWYQIQLQIWIDNAFCCVGIYSKSPV